MLLFFLLIKVQNVAVSDTRGDAICTKARNKKSFIIYRQSFII